MQTPAAFLIVFTSALQVQGEKKCALYSLYERKCEDDTMYHTIALQLGKTYSSSIVFRGVRMTVDVMYTCVDGEVQAEYTTRSMYSSATEIEHHGSSCEQLADYSDLLGDWKKYGMWHCGPCCRGDVPERCGDKFHTMTLEQQDRHTELFVAFMRSEGITGVERLTTSGDFRMRWINFCSQSSSRKSQCCAWFASVSAHDDGCFAYNPNNPHSDPVQSYEELCPAEADEVRAKIDNTESVATCPVGVDIVAIVVGVTAGAIVLVSLCLCLLWRHFRKSSSAPAAPMKDEEAQLEQQPVQLGKADPAVAQVDSGDS